MALSGEALLLMMLVWSTKKTANPLMSKAKTGLPSSKQKQNPQLELQNYRWLQKVKLKLKQELKLKPKAKTTAAST